MIPWLRGQAPFPPIEAALHKPNGLLAAGGELTPERLLEAYSRGIFPWYSDGQPVLWWSPDPRTVLFVDEFKIPRSLRKVVAQRRFEVRVDTAFREVIQRCAEPRSRERRTWITPVMMDAYTALHAQGHAHSVESWDEDGLVGGLYGVAVGRVFFGESMFARKGDASKVALVRLVAILQRLVVPFIDCQQETEHLSRFGARPIDRNEFAEHLSRLVHSTLPAHAWKDAAQAESSP